MFFLYNTSSGKQYILFDLKSNGFRDFLSMILRLFYVQMTATNNVVMIDNSYTSVLFFEGLFEGAWPKPTQLFS